jgi:hypothetical protein
MYLKIRKWLAPFLLGEEVGVIGREAYQSLKVDVALLEDSVWLCVIPSNRGGV